MQVHLIGYRDGGRIMRDDLVVPGEGEENYVLARDARVVTVPFSPLEERMQKEKPEVFARLQKLKEIIQEDISDDDHFVVYCGDGKLFDPKTGDELRHINAVKMILSELDYKASQFTAKENMATRMELVDAFNKGEIDALAAIRCLDEGINIPSIKSALILSSNDDYREFVQRRGRILRLYGNKKFAKIYDVVVLPSEETASWAEIELHTKVLIKQETP